MKEKVVESLPVVKGFSDSEILSLIEIPKEASMGDYALPCFSFSKALKKSPTEIAKEIYDRLRLNDFFERAEVKGPYINFYIDKRKLAVSLLKEISEKGDNYGREEKDKEKVMIEYSQANTHKAFHIGHVKGTSLGESLARIMDFRGNNVLRVNYQGDTGAHVAKWLWCYLKYHKKHKLQGDESWIAGIYVEAVKRLEEEPELEEEVKEINKKLEEGKDGELKALWEETRKLSLDAFEKIYEELNTAFDEYFFESEVEKRGKEIAHELLKKGIAEISEEAVIIDFKKKGFENLGVWVLLRKDGTVLYSAKDIALAERKFKEFKIDKAVYVVGNAQRLHIQQLFKTLELMEFKNADKCRYVPIYEVRFPWGKMSSRTGDNIIYSEFKEELVDDAVRELEKRYKLEPEELYDRALAIAVSALKYTMLKQDVNKNIIFDKTEAMRFEGDTGPYLLYSYARALSILEKADYKKEEDFSVSELGESEKRLISELNNFKGVIDKAYEELDPSGIANYAYNLAKTFNEFYHNCKVIGEKEEQFRLNLVESFSQVLKNALYLLGINVIRKM